MQVGLQEGGVNSFGVFHRIPMNLDTVVVMGLVHHPMYVVVISSPIDSFKFSFMHVICNAVHVHMHAHAHVHAHTSMHVYICIYVCAQGSLYSSPAHLYRLGVAM